MKSKIKNPWRTQLARLSAGVLGLALAGTCLGQEAKPSEPYVSRSDYERVLKELAAIKQRLGLVEEQKATQDKQTEETFNDYDKELKAIKSLASAAQPGLSKTLITGYGFAGFADHKDEVSSFSAGFNPIFLWKPTDRLFFEGELEVELEGGDTMVALEYSQLSYLLNDYVTLGVGKFLSPNNYFMERLHPAWINKLPDKPLMFDGDMRLLASTQLGAQVRGIVPLGATKIRYALYAANGPSLRTTGASAGALKFKTFEDINDNKAVGGRVGFFPIPQLEVGYGFEVANAGASGTAFGDVRAVARTVDLNYVRASARRKGTLDFRTQWAWLNIDNPNAGVLTFDNKREGAYAQLAYRPSKLAGFIKEMEFVGRYDWLDLPRFAPNNADEQRWTLGLNYWLTASVVLKAAYEFGDRKEPGHAKENINAFLLQTAIGF